MKTSKTEVLSGRIKSDGKVIQGEMTSQRDAVGIYTLRVPPGKKYLNAVVCSNSGAAWVLFAVDQETDFSCRIVIANNAGTINVDADFSYMCTVTA